MAKSKKKTKSSTSPAVLARSDESFKIHILYGDWHYEETVDRLNGLFEIVGRHPSGERHAGRFGLELDHGRSLLIRDQSTDNLFRFSLSLSAARPGLFVGGQGHPFVCVYEIT